MLIFPGEAFGPLKIDNFAIQMSRFYFIILILSVSWFSLEINAQGCEGNLGENIFLDGDFGSGSANVLMADPGIAPGFTYQTNPPPNDGAYTITNDMAGWNSVWFGWLEIEDNSTDPNGYMMVVNASYEPGLFYEQLVEGLCSDISYEFSADVINLIESGNNYIKPNVSFLIDGVEVYSTGNIEETEQWETHGFTFSTLSGQNSVTLSLRNNAPGGIGNDLAIDNISFRPCGPTALILPFEIENICEDGSPIDLFGTIEGDQYEMPYFQWQQSFDEGVSWEDIPGANTETIQHTNLNTGFYYYRYILANGEQDYLNPYCRVISNIKIVHVVPKFYMVSDSICSGLTYQVGNNDYSNTGIYIDSLISSIGCDSIVTLDLTVVPDPGIEATFEVEDPTCSYTADGSISLLSINNGFEPYLLYIKDMWFPLDEPLEGLSENVYSVYIIDNIGCAYEIPLEIIAPLDFTIDLGEEAELNLGESIIINPEYNYNIDQFNWIGSIGEACKNSCLPLEYIAINSEYLIIEAYNEAGCYATDTLNIRVVKNRNVYFPNIFSPNRDGQNDYFSMFGSSISIEEIESLFVYDRWGNVVFQNTYGDIGDPTMAWDGKYLGRSVNPGVYVYQAKVRFLDGYTEWYTGNVTLIR